jgi:RHS repeat-associated protein
VFFFAGKRPVGGTGSYDFEYRTYDLADGRFLQRDPRGYVDGSNLYTYARNDPLSFVDPLGTDSRQEHPTIGGKLGAGRGRGCPPAGVFGGGGGAADVLARWKPSHPDCRHQRSTWGVRLPQRLPSRLKRSQGCDAGGRAGPP